MSLLTCFSRINPIFGTTILQYDYAYMPATLSLSNMGEPYYGEYDAIAYVYNVQILSHILYMEEYVNIVTLLELTDLNLK